MHQSQYLASRGMVAMVADYRVASRNGVKVESCVEDAKSAIRWVREHATELGVDPERIAAGGGSAGGHLAAAAGTVPGFDLKDENLQVSSLPNAMVLFNPALVLAEAPGLSIAEAEKIAALRQRIGVDPVLISPYDHVHQGVPPTIIFHGRADTTVPYLTADLFTRRMNEMGNRCELVGYDGATHGFFNYGRGDGSAYIDTVRRMDQFLVSLGWLIGEPTIGPE
jgi:acetyl esterase/lipase